MAEITVDQGIIESPCTAIPIKKGEIYTLSSYQMAVSTTVNDAIDGIAEQTSLDDDGAAKTLTAGDKARFYRLGCGRTVDVRSLTGQTWHHGAPVYNAQTAETAGCAGTSSSNSATKIGHYVGADGLQTTADGQLIKVILDVAGGS